MATFSLPKNSKVGTGKHFKSASGKNIRAFKVYRYNPDDTANFGRINSIVPSSNRQLQFGLRLEF